MNEAQLINPQCVSKNMATKNLNSIIREWLAGGRVVYNKGGVMVIENGGEWLIQADEYIIHIIPGKAVAVIMQKRRYVAHAPRWRGRAVEMVRYIILKNAPELRQQILNALPLRK